MFGIAIDGFDILVVGFLKFSHPDFFIMADIIIIFDLSFINKFAEAKKVFLSRTDQIMKILRIFKRGGSISPLFCPSALEDRQAFFDFVIGYFKDREDLNNFIKNLLSLKNIDRSVTHIVLNTVKKEKIIPV